MASLPHRMREMADAIEEIETCLGPHRDSSGRCRLKDLYRASESMYFIIKHCDKEDDAVLQFAFSGIWYLELYIRDVVWRDFGRLIRGGAVTKANTPPVPKTRDEAIETAERCMEATKGVKDEG